MGFVVLKAAVEVAFVEQRLVAKVELDWRRHVFDVEALEDVKHDE